MAITLKKGINVILPAIEIAPYASGTKCTIKRNVTQVERARIIKRTLGVQVAARYLNNRNWSIDAALLILAGVENVRS